MSYDPKSEHTRSVALKVQSLYLHLFIDGDAVPANKKHRPDDSAVLFIKTEGIDDTSSALDSGEAAPSFVAPVDANGQFSVLVKVSEKIKRIVSAKCVRQDASEVISCTLANTSGLSANGDKIVLNIDSAVNLAAGDYRGCLEVQYVVDEQS